LVLVPFSVYCDGLEGTGHSVVTSGVPYYFQPFGWGATLS